jgi:acyl transferase domain-containing protein
VGEFAAACLAGVFELEDAVRLVATRGRLMQAQPQGTMLAVRATPQQLEPLLPDGVCVAAVNAPGLVVVSGPTADIDAFARTLAGQEIQITALVTSHAFHSSMMAPARTPLEGAVAAVSSRSATIPLVSTSTGATLGADAVRDPAYWGAQLMNPVLFAAAASEAAKDATALLEVGPGRTLCTLARQSLSRPGPLAVLPCLGPVQAPGSDLQNLLQAVGQLWLAGARPDWQAVQSGPRRRIALPTYPFERKRFWVQPKPLASQAATHAAAAPAGAATSAPQPQGLDAATADVEQLIRMQLALIAEQLGAIGGSGTGRGSG